MVRFKSGMLASMDERSRVLLSALLGAEAIEDTTVVRTEFWRLNRAEELVSPLAIPEPPEDPSITTTEDVPLPFTIPAR